MKNTLTKMLALILALFTLVSAFVACNGTEGETETEEETYDGTTDFDYISKDLSDYITLSPDAYKNNKVTLGTEFIVTDKDVQEHIDEERFENKVKANGGAQVTDQPIKLGDSAFIYYTGYLNGEKFEGGSNASDKYSYELSIGSGSFIPGFEEGLIGVIPNKTSKENPHSINLTFPEDYGSADLAGKAVVFEVWVEYTIQYTVPEFTDDYVKNTLKFDGTAEEYRATVKKGLQKAATTDAEIEAVAAMVSKLMEEATIHKYPEQSVAYWYGKYVEQYQYYMQMYAMYGYSFKSLDEFVPLYLSLKEGEDWKEKTTELAKEMVKSSLVYHAIAKQQNFSVTDEEFAARAKELAEYYSTEQKTYTADEIIKEIGEGQIRQNILFDEVENFLLDNCTIEYKDK